MGASDNDFTDRFTDSEKELIRPFFSNLDQGVFVLTNLPEVIKGTLFSRYSRSDKSVRRLLLDEFIPDRDVLSAIVGKESERGMAAALSVGKAEDFYQRILVGFGDDSVAELAGAHVACENISSFAGDLLTDSRIGISPLEKSARYVLFDKKVNGKYLWYREPRIMESAHEKLYSDAMDSLFEHYAEWLPVVGDYIKSVEPKQPDTTDRAYESAVRAKVCDVLKNILPASRLLNSGLFGNGRAFEYLLSKLYSSELAEGRELAARIHGELSKVIPTFVKRAKASEYLVGTRESMLSFASANSLDARAGETEAYMRLVDYDKEGEDKVLARMLYPYSSSPAERLEEEVKRMGADKRRELVATYMSKRRNRRDKPGRALESSFYTFEICGSYGMFRDLHRHRVLTIEKQRLTTDLGYEVPPELESVGIEGDYKKLMEGMKEVYRKISADMPIEAQYCVPRAYRMRWYMKFNLRELYHIAELRSSRQGHPAYRKVAQEMKTELAKVQPIFAEYMQVDMNDYALPRLESEKRIDQKLAQLDREKAESGAVA
jgi:thymidylate synthase ThyX